MCVLICEKMSNYSCDLDKVANQAGTTTMPRSQQKDKTMDKIYVLIDIGCHECGDNSMPVGYFTTREAAEAEMERPIEDRPYEDDGTYRYPEVFEVPFVR